ncbi:EIN3-binding F-box protein 1-like [Bidens hawaiensis]|uniref:EIN3-binding F-box protein 1-like n=1 Tax=Bidens hawaiensis TaxID=980011 RepID=UPI004049CF9A
MAENVDAITSLESVPDALRHKLTQALCDSRKMNHHFLNLLASKSPTEIRVLQLDQCGRCLPDYVLYATLNNLPNKLSALTNISIKGACRLSDAGLKALVTSASALRSINLGCCSLLTSDAIIILADKLGSVLKELYIDECFGIDAKSIFPALLNLQHLEVLSMSRSESVNNSFITQFVAVQGHKMKELVLADCTRLTDRAIKVIAESCPGLCAIDLTNVCKLTDASLGHLANGCETIRTMKFSCNTFSDEAVAAYLEARGGTLTELSLNHVDKVAHHTALSLAKHAMKLQSLDLSWCREMMDEALGLIVDSCLSLKMVKLFGCTQITNVFTHGHSNEYAKIVGLQESQILKNIVVPDLLPLRYSSV